MTKQWRLMATAVAGLALAGTTMPADGAWARARDVVEISAERFSFTPSEIKTRVGAVVEIRLRSEDTDHGFRIVGTDTDIRIPKRNRGTATVTFAPTAPGRYTFECSHVCGAGHSFMRGTIVVTE